MLQIEKRNFYVFNILLQDCVEIEYERRENEELGEYQKAYEIWNEVIVWLETRGYEAEVELPRRLAKECKKKI